MILVLSKDMREKEFHLEVVGAYEILGLFQTSHFYCPFYLKVTLQGDGTETSHSGLTVASFPPQLV